MCALQRQGCRAGTFGDHCVCSLKQSLLPPFFTSVAKIIGDSQQIFSLIACAVAEACLWSAAGWTAACQGEFRRPSERRGCYTWGWWRLLETLLSVCQYFHWRICFCVPLERCCRLMWHVPSQQLRQVFAAGVACAWGHHTGTLSPYSRGCGARQV